MLNSGPEIKKKYHLNSIYFYPTGKCNLRCSHCWINPPYEPEPVLDKEELSLVEIKKMIDDGISLGIGSIKLTGGEPFLRKDIADILRYIIAKDLALLIETNATLLTEEMANILVEVNKKKKLFISVSIDGYNSLQHEAVRQVKGCFAGAIRGIEILTKKGIAVQIITVLCQDNKSDLEKIVSLVSGLGARSLKLNVMSGIARGQNMHRQGRGLSIRELLEIKKIISGDLLKEYKINIIYDIPPVLKGENFSESVRIARQCKCNLFGILGILANGDVSLCGIGTNVKELIMGNIRRDSLQDIWEKNPILESLRKDVPYKMYGICGRCVLKAVCLGKCRAEAYYSHKDFTSPFSICQQAFDQGLFPERCLIPERMGVAG